jgi:hypothetical protein
MGSERTNMHSFSFKKVRLTIRKEIDYEKEITFNRNVTVFVGWMRASDL